MSEESSRKKHLERSVRLSVYWECAIYKLGQFALFLGTFSPDDLFSSSNVSFVQWSSDSLNRCFYSPEKTKIKPCFNPNFGRFPFGQVMSDQIFVSLIS